MWPKSTIVVLRFLAISAGILKSSPHCTTLLQVRSEPSLMNHLTYTMVITIDV